MIDDTAICFLVLHDVRERLPLYDSKIITAGGLHVVKSVWEDSVRAFLPIPLVEGEKITADTLRFLISTIEGLQQVDCNMFFLVFVDAGGCLSYYLAKTIYSSLPNATHPASEQEGTS